tara:strand:- start:156138 stop:156500 length:363 start_codon:yes stop_codon:yes gene_type:complete
MKILVVDDSKSIRSLIDFSLSELPDVELTFAEDGLDAIEKLNTLVPDLILTDVNMPHMDGITLTSKCRQELSITCPILILTTEGDRKKKNAGKSAGATGWIIKPFAPEKLKSVIQRFLKS